jgi:putative phosphoesterase
MKLAFISDIHGNFEALKAVLAAIDGMGVQRVHCLGDVVGYHCQVNECCDLLRARGIECVMGNHDWYLAGEGICRRSRSVNDCLAYQRRVITNVNRDWVSSFPVQRRADGVQMVHGGWDNPIDEYLQPSGEYFDGIEGTLFVSGHTHVPLVLEMGARMYCNPGSVGQPRDGDPRASFAVYDGRFAVHRVEYDIDRVWEAMRAAGFDDYYFGGLRTGSRNLRKP